VALVIWVLGTADVLLTQYGRDLGVIAEWNPLMAFLFSISSRLAVSFALLIPAAGLYFLHHVRHSSKMAMPAMCGLLIIKLLVIFLHLNWIVRMRIS